MKQKSTKSEPEEPEFSPRVQPQFNIISNIQTFKDYLQQAKTSKGEPLISKASRETDYLTVDYIDFIKYSPELAEDLSREPQETLKAFDIALQDVRSKDDDENKPRMLNVRFEGVEKLSSNNLRIRDIRVRNYGKFACFTGVINHISETYALILSKKFECPSCGNILNVLQLKPEEQREPSKCGCGRKGRFLELSKECIDAKSMILEEEFDSLEGNQQPNRVEIILKEGLTSTLIEKSLTLGARVCVTGSILEKEVMENRKITNKLRPFIEANYIRPLDDKLKEIEATITKQDIIKFKEFSARPESLDLCTKSFAPHIYGHDEVKVSLILQSYGGVTSHKSKKFNRGNIHILLVGDPSCGKTQLAKFQENVSPKYRYSSGTMVSKSGLTAGITRDELTNMFGIEAGAIVLASGGVCVVDEADKIEDDTLVTLHEAMEEQRISLTKIIKTQLKAETAIIFCANWKGSRFDQFEDKFSQIDMPASLLSRFDLFFDFIDRPDEDKDSKIIEKIINSRSEEIINKEAVDYTFWKKHIIYCRKYNPEMTQEAKDYIKKSYVSIRAKSDMTKGMLSLTARQGEGIYRLAEASARFHLRPVSIEDAERAIYLTNYSLTSLSTDIVTGKVDIDMVGSGISTTKRNLTHEVREIINDECRQYKMFPVETIYQKIPNAEKHKIDEVIELLKKQWDIFEPRNGFISKL